MRGDKVPVIFGLKVRQLREARGLGLKSLSERAGLSPSYLTEIEKGKKYPKVDKIMQLARALGTTYDELVSLKLGQALDPLESFLESPFIEALPLQMFGISPGDIIELVARAPQEASAFIRTIVEIASSYDMQVEHLFYAMLRSYQETHDNYFEEVETAAERFAEEQGWTDDQAVSYDQLRRVTTEGLGIAVDETTLGQRPGLAGFRSIWIAEPPPRLLINPRLSDRQKAFQLGREIGYRELNLKVRGNTSSRAEVGSFEQVLNDFKASYFAGALMIRQASLVRELKAFFRRPRWSGEPLVGMMNRYGVTPEMFIYRLTQIIPTHFSLKPFHFLRVNHRPGSGVFQITKQFKMTGLLMPIGLGWNERHCRRWLSLSILETLAERMAKGNTDSPLIAAQRSHLLSRDAEYFVITLARPLALTPGTLTSVTLGFQLTPEFTSTVAFWNDPDVPRVDINESCERCPLTAEQCDKRAAPPVLLAQQQTLEARNRALEELLAEAHTH